jgi:DNA-binding transcriptional ArsR family regulator
MGGAETFVIKDEAVLKVVADPLRRRILLYLGQPRTIGEVAGLLAQRPQKLHYHFELLARHGLIQVTGHRTSGNHVERLYQVSARSFRVEPALATATGYGVNLGVQTVLEEASARYSQGRDGSRAIGVDR